MPQEQTYLHHPSFPARQEAEQLVIFEVTWRIQGLSVAIERNDILQGFF
jgi:hypothetical protein